MEYVFYCRDKPGVGTLREETTEAHWSFMDHYAAGMVARGPTFSDDEMAVTGSIHIVNLPDAAAAQVFAFEEPYYRAGVFGEVFMRRWRNELGRTMWEFAGDPDRHQRFLIIGHGKPEASEQRGSLPLRRRFIEDNRSQLIACGLLLSDDDATWVGGIMLAQAPDRAAVAELVASDPFAQAGLYQSVEIHRWRFGGRPSA